MMEGQEPPSLFPAITELLFISHELSGSIEGRKILDNSRLSRTISFLGIVSYRHITFHKVIYVQKNND
jgi:hypothetical protein